MSEPKFKIGDEVELICDESFSKLKKGTRFIVQKIQENRIRKNRTSPIQITYSYTDYIYNQVRKPVVPPVFVIPEECLKLFEHHKGKVLIMVDEKDNNKIVARDLVTGKKAEAKRNPNDEWDFEKGAKLAFERLYPEKKEEKPKYWTGKVVCIASNNEDTQEKSDSLFANAFIFFRKGGVYQVIDGVLFSELGRWSDIDGLFKSAKDVNDRIFPFAQFIEYKGEA